MINNLFCGEKLLADLFDFVNLIINLMCCCCRIPRPITADYKRWGPTARRADASTSGFLSWCCRSGEGPGTWIRDPEPEPGSSLSPEAREQLLPMQGRPGAEWAVGGTGSFSDTDSEWTLLQNKQKIPIQATFVFTMFVRLDLSFNFVLLFGCLQYFWGVNIRNGSRQKPHTHLGLCLEGLCVYYGPDRNAAVKLCPTFLCILTWESPWRGVCAWMCGMRAQYSVSFFRNGWVCGACILRMSGRTCGGLVAMETEMGKDVGVESRIGYVGRCRTRWL